VKRYYSILLNLTGGFLRTTLVFETIFLILVLFSFISCEYYPTGTNYVDVTPTYSNPTIILPEVNSMFEVRGTVDINYDLATDGVIFNRIDFYIDSEYICSSDNSSSFLVFHSHYYADGIHTFSIKSILYSSSGSLAANFHLEGYLREQSWTMIIWNAPLEQLDITEVYEYNGRVKINWEPYDGLLFEKYQLRLHGANERNIDFFEQTTTSYIDSIFANGVFWGDVVIYAHNENKDGDGFTLIDYQPQNISFFIEEDNCPKLEWNECIYYANCTGYKIYNSVYEINTITSHEITSWIDDSNPIVFGEIRNYYVIAMNSDYQVYDEFNSQNLKQTHLGSSFTDWYSDIIFNPNGYVYVTNDSIQVFDANSMDLINETFYPDYYTTLGLRFVESSNELFLASWDEIRVLYPNSGTLMEVIHIDYLLSNLINPIMYEFAVSENRFLVRIFSQSTLTGYVIDRNTGDIINVPELLSHVEISSDGNYGLDNSHLYHIDNDNVSIVCDLESEDTHMFQNNEAFVTISGSDILVRRMDDLQTVCNFQTEFALDWIKIAPDTEYLYGSVDGIFQVYDLDTGVLVSQMQVYPNYRYDLYNNTMFSASGLFMEN